MRQQSGFTLIELIMVIVILGILAATAAPKFSNLRQEADGAVLKGIKGSMEGSVAMAHGIWLAQGKMPASDIVFSPGVSISMVNGYPAADNSPDGYTASAVLAGQGIFATLDLPAGSTYSWLAGSGVTGTATSGVTSYGILYKTVVGAASAATCGIKYHFSSGVNIAPLVDDPVITDC